MIPKAMPQDKYANQLEENRQQINAQIEAPDPQQRKVPSHVDLHAK